MTPFDTWYSTHIAPTIPNDAPTIVKKLSQELMVACWNAALDAVNKNYEDQVAKNAENCKPGESIKFELPYIEHLRARVTP
jgi:hypothetical protein